MIVSEKKIEYSGSNIPGVLTVFLIDRLNVLSVLDPIRHRLPGTRPSKVPFGGIVLAQGTEIVRMKFPPLTATYSQPADRSDAGSTYSMGISFSMPGFSADLFDFVLANSQKQWVCLMEDTNRQCYILGNEERGLRLAWQHTINSTNATSINISAKLNVPALFLEVSERGLVLADLFPDTDFSSDFSLDFNA